jgi:oligoribonuclease
MTEILVWADLETTGLDPNHHDILEIAVATAPLTDPFKLTHVFHAVLPCFSRKALSPFILDMHTKNGLLAECAESRENEDSVEMALLKELDKFKGETLVLAGSSVHFDAGFLKGHMPIVGARFSHRYYDVSAVKLFCRSLGMIAIPKAEAHRAKEDIEESAAHAKLCADWLLKQGVPAVELEIEAEETGRSEGMSKALRRLRLARNTR